MALAAAGVVTLGQLQRTHSMDSPRVIEVTAGDFFFRAPDSVPAGRVRIRLRSAGKEPHHMQLVRYDSAHSLGEVMRVMTKPEVNVPWITFVGGPGTPPRDGVSEVETTLAPGRYALLCFVTFRGVRHLAMGMLRALTVTGRASDRVAPASEPNTIILRDHDYLLAHPLRVGKQRIRVTNLGSQPHEAGVWMLNPGTTEAAARDWFAHPSGPPPATPVGGAMVLSPGESNVLPVDLPSGTAVLFCYVPDSRDGRSHVSHGMLAFSEVR